MRIAWTSHARLRQEAWQASIGITVHDVEELLLLPPQVVEGEEGARVAQRPWKGGLLRVVFLDLAEERRILTLYWTSRVERYWKRG